MPYTLVADERVHWVTSGRGPALVLLHGLGGDVSFWDAQMPALSSKHQVIAIDLRGSGDTPSMLEGQTIQDLCEDVAGVLDDLGIRSASILGFSLGGLVAQAFATDHPTRVTRLILASTYAVMNAQARLFLDAVDGAYAQLQSEKQMFDLICPWLFSSHFFDDPANAVYTEYPAANTEPPVTPWRRLYAAQRAFDWRSNLARISAPTAVFHGALDSLVSASDAQELARGIRGAKLLTFHDSGHLMGIEEPDRFLAEITESLEMDP